MIVRNDNHNTFEHVAETLARIEKEHAGVQIGSYPFWREGQVGANFVLRATDAGALDSAATALLDALAAQGIDPVDGEI